MRRGAVWSGGPRPAGVSPSLFLMGRPFEKITLSHRSAFSEYSMENRKKQNKIKKRKEKVLAENVRENQRTSSARHLRHATRKGFLFGFQNLATRQEHETGSRCCAAWRRCSRAARADPLHGIQTKSTSSLIWKRTREIP